MKYSIKRNIHTDFSVFEENRLPARSYFIPFSSESALNETNYKNERYVSDRVIMLSGEWDFTYYSRLSDIAEEIDTSSMNFDSISVPSTWQRTGYDQIAYINTRYPFPKKPPHIPEDVAVGIYRKSFICEKESGKKILTFLGVAGALCVYINGEYIGYSEGSHNTAEFDISGNLDLGENEIVCVVYKWSNGTYLECQDMFRENGIFRDVYILLHNESRINDFCLRASKNENKTYDLKISVDGEFSNEDSLIIKAGNEDGELFNARLLPNKECSLTSLSVNEWSAEIPNIYKVDFILCSGGETAEVIRTYIGFKDVKINKEIFTFNGKAIKIKGVNHHDTHMTKGYAVSLDDLELDIKLMKEYNCNAVRTSHYPPDPAFLTMCDFYGLYVIDEADIETHGFYSVPGTYRPGRLSNNLKWASHYLDRVTRMYERDKNHPSITMWSLGNESGGYKCQDVCYDFLKKKNPEIPVHYEGVNRSKRWAYDVVSHMYAKPELMRKVRDGKGGKKYEGKPFFQCEYAHAMGNGPGGLEEYMQLFYSSKQFMGGCIWEWADHCVYDENAKYKWTYGGDHNEPIHDSNFCVDGLFYPDRRPSTGALEMKAVYRPVRARKISNTTVELRNTMSFSDTSNIKILWELVKNGLITACGEFSELLLPEEKKQFEIACESENMNEDIFLNIIYSQRETGFEIAREQLILCEKKLPCAKKNSSADVSENKTEIRVSFGNSNAVFNKKKGLVSLVFNGKEMLNKHPVDSQHGFVPHIYRGMLDNDRYMMIYWKILGLEDALPKLVSCKLVNKNNLEFIRVKYLFVTRGIFILASANVDYYFSDNGTVEVVPYLKKVCPMTAQLPRFGVHCEMNGELENVKYYGRGPKESYSDFKEHAPVGIYETTVEKMAHKYIKPQDSGNRTDVRLAVLCQRNNRDGIEFDALDKYFNFNANRFTLGELIKAGHIEDLPDRNTTFVTVDGFVRGTGSGSCGPIPSKEHLIDFGYTKSLEYSFSFKSL